ncbi:MAG: 2-dehydropantoate 2-reductase [Pseudomonadota bacterium]
MRIAVIGAGGVGGMLAVRLAAAGHEVSVVARGAHLAAIREHGLRLVTPDDDLTMRPAAAATTGADLGPADLVIVAVKGQDLEGAMDLMAPLMAGQGALGPVVALPFLNGVEATSMLAARFGTGQALIGTARISAFIEAPGVVRQATAKASYILGDAAGRQDGAAVTAIRTAFGAAGIAAPDCADVRRDLWAKFAVLVALAGVTAGARCDVGTLRATPALGDLFRRLSAEVVALAAAEGVTLPDSQPEEAYGFMSRLGAEVRASMAFDLASGKALEVDWLNGAVARLSAAHGIEAPANATVAALLAPFRDGARA